MPSKKYRSGLTLNQTLNNAIAHGVNQRQYQRESASTAFTYIEILIALAVIAVLFIPMTQLFSHAIYSATVSGEKITAVNLVRWEMERVKNLNVTKSGLKKIGDVWTPKLDEPPFEMNQAKWRILRRINSDTDPLEVRVEAYRADNLKKPVASAITLVEDNIWIEKNIEAD